MYWPRETQRGDDKRNRERGKEGRRDGRREVGRERGREGRREGSQFSFQMVWGKAMMSSLVKAHCYFFGFTYM